MAAVAPDDPDFAAMMVAVKAGDELALERILKLTEDQLRSCVDQRLGPRLKASLRRSDVLQNAYVTMLDALSGFVGRTRGEFVAWVAQIIEHDIRRQSRWFGARKRRPATRTSQRNALAEILFNMPPTPSAEAARGEERAAVLAALARLEPEYAQVIELSVFEELSHREIATRLGRSEGACRMLLLRARAALAMELERLAHGPARDQVVRPD